MLCLEDCLDFCELDENEVDAIAAHEHIPVICAAEMGSALLKTPEGVRQLHTMVIEDFESAVEHHNKERAVHWAETYQHLQATHHL